LHDQGVADLVLNYMQETYLNAVRREQDLADWSHSGNGGAIIFGKRQGLGKEPADAKDNEKSAGEQGE